MLRFHPGVEGGQARYVAGSACAGCHAEIAKSYRQTGMGRSFYRPSAISVVEDYARLNRIYHQPSGRCYTMFERNGQWFQSRYQIGFEGNETNFLEARIDYVIGSGNHARSYLHRTAAGASSNCP
jgi:hypothetical protein